MQPSTSSTTLITLVIMLVIAFGVLSTVAGESGIESVTGKVIGITGFVPGAPPNQGLVLNYAFSKADLLRGTVNDLAGIRDGVVNGGVSGIGGPVGDAAEFDGVDDHIVIPPIVMGSLNQWTISSWVFPRALTDQSSFWLGDRSAGTSYPTLLFEQDQSALITLYAANTKFFLLHSRDNPLPINTWTHVAVAFVGGAAGGGGVATLFINGEKKGFIGANPGQNSVLSASAVARLGGGAGDGALPFNGNIDEFRIYNRPLTIDEVTALFNQGKDEAARLNALAGGGAGGGGGGVDCVDPDANLGEPSAQAAVKTSIIFGDERGGDSCVRESFGGDRLSQELNEQTCTVVKRKMRVHSVTVDCALLGNKVCTDGACVAPAPDGGGVDVGAGTWFERQENTNIFQKK